MRLLGWFGFILLLCATAAMAGSYAYATGLTHGPVWAWVFAASVVALLASESALAAGKGRGSCPAVLRWVALIVALASVYSLEVGFTASVFTDARATRASDTAANTAAADVEPVGVVRAMLEAQEGANRGINATWCGRRDADDRDACRTWTDLKVRLAAAEAVEKRGTVRPTGDADARSALFSRVLGGTQSAWADSLVLLLAAALSLARVACAAMLLGEPAPVAVAVPAMVADPKPEAPEAVPVVSHARDASPVVSQEPAPIEPQAPEPVAPAAVDLPKPAKRVLSVVSSIATPAQGFAGFIPPGMLSQRALSDKAGLTRRQTADGLSALEAAGVLKVTPHGREGSSYAVLKP